MKKWPLCSETPGQKNVVLTALGSKPNIYFLSLHIMFGLIKISVKVMDK
jgi:hypothetical protein